MYFKWQFFSHSSIQEFGRDTYNQALAEGISKPLHALARPWPLKNSFMVH